MYANYFDLKIFICALKILAISLNFDSTII